MNTLVVTAEEAARMLRTRPDAILKRLEHGEIPAYREGRGWKIPRSLLEVYVENMALAEAKGRREIHEMESKKV